MALAGHCRYGDVRFEVADDAGPGTGDCHCLICRRLSGARVKAWVASVSPR